MEHIAPHVTAISKAMVIGDFETAVDTYDACVVSEGIEKSLIEQLKTEEETLDPTRAQHAAVVAQLLFYLGEHTKAEELLERYSKREDEFLSLDIPSHAKLQLAQYYHSCRSFRRAIDVATEVEAQCKHRDDWLGMALCEDQKSRALARLDEFPSSEGSSDQAMAYLARLGKERDKHISWEKKLAVAQYMGRVFLTRGNALLVAGDLSKSESKLFPALFFLENTGDFIGIANVQHGLGCVFYAKGNHDSALKWFRKAMYGYSRKNREHNLHLSRLYLDQGKANFSQRNLKKAEKYFSRALTYANSISNRRQIALANLSLSMLYQDDEYINISKAESSYRKAKSYLRTMTSNRRSILQAEFVHGSLMIKKRKYDEAHKIFKYALEDAKKLNVNSLTILAYLYMSEICHYKGSLRRSIYFLDCAKDIISKIDEEDEITYEIKTKLYSVYRSIDAYHETMFILNYDKMKEDESGILDILNDVRRWVVNTTLKETKGDRKQAATVLKISRPGLDKIIQRVNPVSN